MGRYKTSAQKSSKPKKIILDHKYDAYNLKPFHTGFLFEEDDLWSLPIPEFLAFDYAAAILYILKAHKKDAVSYSEIREIFDHHKIPVFLGLVMQGVNQLVWQYRVIKERKGNVLYIKEVR